MYDEELFQKRLNAFTPEPLVPPIEQNGGILEIPMVREDENNIDLAKTNYLNFLNNEEIKKAAEEVIRVYGMGTCGPLTFYGTTDVYLELEECLAKFLRTEASMVYSYGFVAISSAVAAISSSLTAHLKRNDIIFVDERANFPIQQGLLAARTRVIRFAHNDSDSFRQMLEIVDNEKKQSRKFLIIEGVSWSTGKLCPLPDFLAVAEEFKVRVFLEETYSVGVFGATGRGLTEHFDVDPARVDMIFGTLEGAIGSIGGFCAGSNVIIEHQRMSGSGYVFSASPTTCLVKAVTKSLELMGDKPKKLAGLAKTFHEFLEEECKFRVKSHPEAPFKLITTTPKDGESKIYQYCKDNGVHFIHNDSGLMINLNIGLLEDEEKLKRVYRVLKRASDLMNKQS